MTYEVCYHVADGIYSTNMLKGREMDCRAEAEAHASRFGYDIVSFKPINPCEVDAYLAKGMPLKKVPKKGKLMLDN